MFGMLGMLITSVLVPLLGLLAMILFEGNYYDFFRKIGRIPGTAMIVLILMLIGPFAGIPRCIAISHSTLTATFGIDAFPGVNLLTFSAFSCLIIFLFTYRPTKILGLLGKVLTPLLLLSLGVIAVKGLFGMPPAGLSEHGRFETFLNGFVEGYNTMDLLASFFFSSVVLVCLRQQFKNEDEQKNRKRMMTIAIFGALIAAFLLTVIYFSFSLLAAGYSNSLDSVANHQLLGTLAYQILGPYGSPVVGASVLFAVLTTEIALTAIFSKFLQEKILRNKIPYHFALVITLAIAFCVSTLQFDGIVALVNPVLQFFYPALIALALLNILHKVYNFKHIKLLFYGTVATTFLVRLLFVGGA